MQYKTEQKQEKQKQLVTVVKTKGHAIALRSKYEVTCPIRSTGFRRKKIPNNNWIEKEFGGNDGHTRHMFLKKKDN